MNLSRVHVRLFQGQIDGSYSAATIFNHKTLTGEWRRLQDIGQELVPGGNDAGFSQILDGDAAIQSARIQYLETVGIHGETHGRCPAFRRVVTMLQGVGNGLAYS